ncbi:MAG TPA: type II toxin-antitoxin system VapC family toxin [Thermoanaerobaculia bacterium]|jgi:predicted nucleic acid-binding protein
MSEKYQKHHTLVVDASVVLALLLRTKEAGKVRDKIITHNGHLAAPHLLDVEITEVLHRCCNAGELTPERARCALSDLADLPIHRYAHQSYLEWIWDRRDEVTIADGVYLALARFLSVPLLTLDDRLRGLPEVELVD